MKVLLLDIDKPKPGKYQFFLDWFKESWVKAGGEVHSKIEFPYKLRMAAAKLRLGKKTILASKERALLVLGGAYIDFTAFPYNYFHEIIPVFWDTWERYHPLLISGLKRNKIKYAFFTQKEVAELMQTKVPGIRTFWMPEGIKINSYTKGLELSVRNIDILQFGRKVENYHHVVINTINNSHNYLYSEHELHRLFDTFDDLTSGLSDTAISLCFPRSITHPVLTGGIETLTQRYWESILSGCLIVGKAPKELIHLMGYNPVIEVDWSNPQNQLKGILKSIDRYQDFVNKNYLRAVEICSWDCRVKELMKRLKELEFEI